MIFIFQIYFYWKEYNFLESVLSQERISPITLEIDFNPHYYLKHLLKTLAYKYVWTIYIDYLDLNVTLSTN